MLKTIAFWGYPCLGGQPRLATLNREEAKPLCPARSPAITTVLITCNDWPWHPRLSLSVISVQTAATSLPDILGAVTRAMHKNGG